jgi:hypothetical protein
MTWSQLKTLLNNAKVHSDGRETYWFGGAR